MIENKDDTDEQYHPYVHLKKLNAEFKEKKKKNFPSRKAPGPDGFKVEFSEHVRGKCYKFSMKSSRKYKRRENFPTTHYSCLEERDKQTQEPPGGISSKQHLFPQI